MFNGDRSSKYPNAQDMVSDGIPFINAGDLEDGHVNLVTCNKITREKYDDLGGAKLQLGDIVYCLRGTLGKNAYIDNFNEGTVASSLVALRPKDIDGRYLFHVLNSDIEYKQRVVHDEGAAQPNLSAKSVSEFIMPAWFIIELGILLLKIIIKDAPAHILMSSLIMGGIIGLGFMLAGRYALRRYDNMSRTDAFVGACTTSLYLLIIWFPLVLFIGTKILFMKKDMNWGKTTHGLISHEHAIQRAKEKIKQAKEELRKLLISK